MTQTDTPKVDGAAHPPRMRYRILGPICAERGSEEIALGGPRQRRLLGAFIVADGRAVSVDRLVDAVWADEPAPPDAATKTVLSYISRLRSALGEASISTQGAAYRLDLEHADLDADRFVELVDEARNSPPGRALGLLDDALELWRGPAFGELADELWARPTVTRLEEQHIIALEERAQARLDLGAHAAGVAELQELVELHPLRERFRLQLMLALHRSGRQAEALRVFQDYRHYLADETGLEPSRELVELERRIALDDPSLAFVATGRTARGYVLADVLGEGAFGLVYRAVQPSVGREVAVKVVRAELADDPAFIRRFEAEARLVARLEHPHIVPLYDFWREPGGAYLVFRFLSGGTAADRAGAWPLTHVDRLVTEIGSALVAAHAAEVVHRDVKPANLLFDKSGAAYLADFGIARDAAANSAVVALRSAGSPMYASPEQVRDGVADARSDQYALAVVVWELLAGSAPFEDATVGSLLRTKLTRPLNPLTTLRPDVPQEVTEVLRRATAVHPDDRFASIADFVLAWSAAVSRPAAVTVTADELAAARRTGAVTLASVGVAVNPYKGLRAFDEGDVLDYFGRADATEALAAFSTDHGFVAVVGPSGAGKSSLVRAGLVPRLRAGGALVAVMVPGPRPLDELAAALVQIAVRTPSNLASRLRRPETWDALVDEMLPESGPITLVVDQFEELWTSAEAGDRAAFLAGLVALRSSDRMRVVVSLRADFYDRPLADPHVGALASAGTFAVTPLGPAELEQAITGPAERIGVRVEPALVASLVADAAARPAALPLLQYALTELFDRRSGPTMTAKSYEALGGLAGVIGSRAEAVFSALDQDGRAGARVLFTHLVNPLATGEDTRRRTRRAELAAVPSGVIDAFGSARLITFDVEPNDRTPTVEIAHEALLRNWPRLQKWLEEDRDGLRLHAHLAGAAEGWNTAGREPGELYRGARLEAAEQWAVDNSNALRPVEADFVAMSVAERTRLASLDQRSRRRIRRALVGVAVVAVAAIVAASLAVRAQHDAERRERIADVRRLDAEAGDLVTSNRNVALLLAAEAYRMDPSPEALRGVHNVLLRLDRGWLGSIQGRQPYRVAQFVPGTNLLLAGGAGGADLVDLDTRHVVRSFELTQEDVTAGAVSTRHVALGTGSGRWIVLDRSTGQEVASGTLGGEVVAASFDHAGNRLAVGTSSSVELHGVGTAAPTVALAVVAKTFHLEWSGDDRRILVAGGVGAPAQQYDTSTGQPSGPAMISGKWGSVGAIYVGDAIAVWGTNITLFDATTQLVRRDTTTKYTDPLGGGLILLDDDTALAVNISGQLAELDLLTGEFRMYESELSTALNELSLSPDRDTLAVAGGDGIDLWSRSGQRVLGKTVPNMKNMAVVTADGATLVVTGPNNADPTSQGIAWDLTGPQPVVRRDFGAGVKSVRTRSNVVALQLADPDATDDSADHVALWWPSTDTFVDLEGFAPGHLLTFDVSPDGRFVALPSPVDGMVRIFDGATGALVTVLSDMANVPREAPSVLALWLGETEFSPDGRRLIAANIGGETTAVWDTSSWQLAAPLLRGTAGFSDIAFNRDGTKAATLGGDPEVLQLRDPTTLAPLGEPVLAATTLGGAGTRIQFSDDERYLATVGAGAVQLWDAKTLEPIGRGFPAESNNRWSGEYATAAQVISGDLGDDAVVWDADPTHWLDLACRAAGRNLTQDEWDQFGPDTRSYEPTCDEWPSEPTA